MIYDQKRHVEELDYARRNLDTAQIAKAEKRLRKEVYEVGYWTARFDADWVYSKEEERERQRKLEEWKEFKHRHQRMSEDGVFSQEERGRGERSKGREERRRER